MKYIPNVTQREIAENHKHFKGRVELYKKFGVNFVNTGDFILQKAQPIKNKILEIGSGNGYTALALAKGGYKFISIDNNKESLKKAFLNLAYEKLLSNVVFYNMDARLLSFKDKSFHTIVIVNFFHHTEEVDNILFQIDRVLCPNGKLVIADFNKQGMKIIGSVHRNEGHMHENAGVSKDYIYAYFNSSGYEIEEYKEKHHWILVGKKKIQQ
ncbi:MAG: class I SAM-dependent methyltransferase [Candidatus Zapsychrus exili]|nr:class I SAM-dependent methyltransferase [Candidatus Zapsychrus exili]